MTYPFGTALDAHGNLWVTNAYGNDVLKFSPSGTLLATYSEWGSGAGQVEEPLGIAINQSTGIVYVADQNNNRIDEFNENGEPHGQFGVAGSKLGQFDEPDGVAIDAKGDVWVTDWGNSRVEEFSSSGSPLAAYGSAGTGEGQFNGPSGIAFYKGDLYVADANNNRVQELSEENGAYKGEFNGAGSAGGQVAEPDGIAISSSGTVYVSDYGGNRVEEFTSSGAFVAAFGESGSGPGELSEPGLLALDSAGDVYVVDSANNRVEKWVPDKLGAHDTQTIYYSTTPNSTHPACGGHSEWANLPCQTQPAEQPGASGLPNLPVTTTTYNIWDEPEKTEQTVGSEKRTTTLAYDGAGRTTKSSIISSTGKSQPTVTDTYSQATGALIEQTAEGRTITSVFNTLGQLKSYTDADGNVSTYTYDVDGRPLTANDGSGIQTYTYDETTGDLTKLVDSGAGTFGATYNVEGQLERETYPNAMVGTHTYDSIGEATALSYTKGSSTWYEDRVNPSIHGQWLSQQSTLSTESYTYDQLGRMTEVTETPQGKGCSVFLYSYDEDSNRTSETKRTSEGACATQGGTTTAHSYDEADRLTDSGTGYEPFGGATAVPAQDAGGHPLESKYYAGGALYNQSQNGQTNTYELDPAGRVRETITVTGLESKTTISHYSGSGSGPAWTTTAGVWTRNVAGIGGGIAATETQGKEAEFQLSNLHGDVIGTVKNSSGAQPALTSEPTAFGVPTSTPSKYSWMGSGGLQTEFSSGVAGGAGGVYVPQLGLHLEPAGLSGEAAQDPVNEYLANEDESEPTGTWSGERVDAVMPPPVNTMVSREFWESEPWNAPPVNVVDPTRAGLLNWEQTLRVANILKEDADNGELLALGLQLFAPVVGEIVGGGVAAYAAYLRGWAHNLEVCASIARTARPTGRCYVTVHTGNVNLGFTTLEIPIWGRNEFCEFADSLGHRNFYVCLASGTIRSARR